MADELVPACTPCILKLNLTKSLLSFLVCNRAGPIEPLINQIGISSQYAQKECWHRRAGRQPAGHFKTRIHHPPPKGVEPSGSALILTRKVIMNEKEIIEALVNNELPFVLMPKEMQAFLIAKKFKYSDVQCLRVGPLEWVALESYPQFHRSDLASGSTCTYRLRPDYKESSLKGDLIKAMEDSRKNCLMKPWEFVHKAIGLLDGKDNRLMGHGVKDCSISAYDAIGTLIADIESNWPESIDNSDGLTGLISSWNSSNAKANP